MTRWLLSLAAVLPCWLDWSVAHACGDADWVEVESEVAHREDCYQASSGEEIGFVLVRFNPSRSKLSVVGGLADLSVPSAKTIVDEERISKLVPMRDVFQADDALRILVPVGDVIAEEYRLPGGLVRRDGVDIADRNNWSGASAFLCLNDKSQNAPAGASAFVMFNAFERGEPVEMNKRVADSSNCPDVVQVGPRIVEYRAKRGIPASERSLAKNRLNYVVFAQGSGPKYDAYILFNREPTNLFYLQEMLLSRNVISDDDRMMRMAVNLISGDPASLIAGADGKIVVSEGNASDLAWPTYLAVSLNE